MIKINKSFIKFLFMIGLLSALGYLINKSLFFGTLDFLKGKFVVIGQASDVISQASIVFLTFMLFVVAYQNWTSPKTSLRGRGLSTGTNELQIPGEKKCLRINTLTLQLVNVGTTASVFRVQVWFPGGEELNFVDETVGEELGSEFNSCLFAQNPVPAHIRTGVIQEVPREYPTTYKTQETGSFPKRSKIYRGDFNNFSTYFGWVDESRRKIIELPVSQQSERKTHRIGFKVQQTGEKYIFEYDSEDSKDGEIKDGEIVEHSISKIAEYGGKSFIGKMKELYYEVRGLLGGRFDFSIQ